MAYRYIPPHLRGTSQDAGSGSSTNSMPSYPVSSGLRGGDGSRRSFNSKPDALPEDGVYSLEEIKRHFWPQDDPELTSQRSKTLHDSAITPGALAYVLLFAGANPRWEKDGIIFTKSSLDLLPSDVPNDTGDVSAPGSAAAPNVAFKDQSNQSETTSDASQNKPLDFDEQQNSKATHTNPIKSATAASGSDTGDHQPIAIFTQLRRPPYDPNSTTFRSFTFSGYYRLTHLQFLEPHSDELKKMLEQKWATTNTRTGYVKHRQRDPASWNESLKLRWAVLKFEKDAKADEEPGKPQIERIEHDKMDDLNSGKEKKSVNEMLKEMRMRDSAVQDGKKENRTKSEDITTAVANGGNTSQ